MAVVLREYKKIMQSSWIYLLSAIFCEALGLTAMKLASTTHPVIGLTCMYVMICLSFYLLSLAVRRIPLGVAYALWEGVGLILVTVISVVVFSEHLSFYKAAGLSCMVAGVLLIKSGTYSPPAMKEKEHRLQEAM